MATSSLDNARLSETRRPIIYGATISCYLLAVVAVGLRFVSRRLVKADILADDWLIIVALVRSFCNHACSRSNLFSWVGLCDCRFRPQYGLYVTLPRFSTCTDSIRLQGQRTA